MQNMQRIKWTVLFNKKISNVHLLKFFSLRNTGSYKDAVPEILTEE